MDPVSYLFSAYLNSVQTSTYNHLTESMGTEIKAVVIKHEGTKIPFQHQLWKIRESSVCKSMGNNISRYSQCTMSAAKLFNDLCSSLSSSPKSDWRYTKTKNMYCNAAVTYKPTVASISSASNKTEIQEAKSTCNSATIVAMTNKDYKLIKERDLACKKYRDLKKKP